MDRDDLDQRDFALLETIGKAVGFAMGAAAADGAKFGTRAGMQAFAATLMDATEEERFSPDVCLTLRGLAEGIEAFAGLDPDKPEWL